MSELPAFDENYSAVEATANEDATRPTAEILSALEQLNEPQHFTAQEPPKSEDEVPHFEWDILRAQLRDKPNDPEGWRRLVDIAESGGDIEKIKTTYEALLETYPGTASAQIAYLGHFLIPGFFAFAEDMFIRFLKTSASMELWTSYLTYLRRANAGAAAREALRMAYEFALTQVGQDKDSGQIWNDYIQFLRAGETTTTWEEQQKMGALRKVYHRAVKIPLENIEQLWQELEAFETGLNRITAKKIMADLSPSYTQARKVLRQLQKHIGPLFPVIPPSNTGRPTLFLPALPTFNPPEQVLVWAWKNYLKWEESNPLEIEDKNKATLITRVQGVYRKALVRMRFYAEIWYMAYVWTGSVSKPEEAFSILKAGIIVHPSSFLLNFAYAELQEAKKEYNDVHASFEKFLEVLRNNLDALEQRVNAENSSFLSNKNGKAAANESAVVNGSGATHSPVAPTHEAGLNSNKSSFATQPSEGKPLKSKELSEKRTEYGLVWIMYMRFSRRAKGIKSSRALFAKSRKERWTPWEVFEAAALMEYHCSKNISVASHIFEKGMEVFGEEIEFVLRFLGFLISVNDETNARSLFERVITTFSPERARPLWERWARYEYQYGDLEAARKLEKRISEVYPTDPPIKRFAQRHIYMGTDAIAARDLGFAMARQAGHGAGSAGSSTSSLGGRETQQSPISKTNSGAPPWNKRPSLPDHRKCEEPRAPGDYGPPVRKRPRPMSSKRDRDRERWEGPSRQRFLPPAALERERERDGPPPQRRLKRERDDEKGRDLPHVISWFMGQPAAATFDGENVLVPQESLKANGI